MRANCSRIVIELLHNCNKNCYRIAVELLQNCRKLLQNCTNYIPSIEIAEKLLQNGKAIIAALLLQFSANNNANDSTILQRGSAQYSVTSGRCKAEKLLYLQ